jgi:hypothetical protein
MNQNYPWKFTMADLTARRDNQPHATASVPDSDTDDTDTPHASATFRTEQQIELVDESFSTEGSHERFLTLKIIIGPTSMLELLSQVMKKNLSWNLMLMEKMTLSLMTVHRIYYVARCR